MNWLFAAQGPAEPFRRRAEVFLNTEDSPCMVNSADIAAC